MKKELINKTLGNALKEADQEDEEKKIWIIKFTKEFYKNIKTIPSLTDFTNQGISRANIRKLFTNIGNLSRLCGIEYTRRKINLSDEEIKIYIKSIAIKKSSYFCEKRGTPCWTTDKHSSLSGTRRPVMGHKGKVRLLSRLTYELFNEPLISDKIIMHICNHEDCFNPEHLEQGTHKDNARYREILNRGNHLGSKQGRIKHNLTGPNDPNLLSYVKTKIIISSKNEWLYPHVGAGGYAIINIKSRPYRLHRLLLANKLGMKYEEIDQACHKFQDGLPYSNEVPARNDVNPDHLYDGTKKQNANDALVSSKRLKITPEIKKFIIEEAVKTKEPAATFDARMAFKFNVSIDSISRIRLLNNKLFYKKKVSKIDVKTGMIIQNFNSAAEAGRSGFSASKISNVLMDKQKTHKGFIWKYA